MMLQKRMQILRKLNLKLIGQILKNIHQRSWIKRLWMDASKEWSPIKLLQEYGLF
jgi:hypothetical protein